MKFLCLIVQSSVFIFFIIFIYFFKSSDEDCYFYLRVMLLMDSLKDRVQITTVVFDEIWDFNLQSYWDWKWELRWYSRFDTSRLKCVFYSAKCSYYANLSGVYQFVYRRGFSSFYDYCFVFSPGLFWSWIWPNFYILVLVLPEVMSNYYFVLFKKSFIILL